MRHKLYCTFKAVFIFIWSIALGYPTFAQVTSYPYTEDFESFTVANNASGFTNGWSASPSNISTSFRWNVDSNGTPSSNTGPSKDNTLGDVTGKYIYTEATSGFTGATAELISPVFDFTGLVNPTVSFYYHMYGSSMGTLRVDVFDGSTWTDGVWTISGQQHLSDDADWSNQEVILKDYGGLSNVQFRFTGVRAANFRGDMAVDDVLVYDKNSIDPEIIAMPSPVASTPHNSTQSITFNVRNDGADTLNFTSTPLFLSVNVTKPDFSVDVPSTSVTFGTLAPGEVMSVDAAAAYTFDQIGTYNFEGQISLSGDEEASNNLLTDNTVVEPVVSSFPYHESFESGDGDWFAVSPTGSSSWERGKPVNTFINRAADGDVAWVTSLSGNHNSSEISYVESPYFEMGSLTQPYFQLDIIGDFGFFAGATLEMSSDNGETWNRLGSSTSGFNWYQASNSAPSGDSWDEQFDWMQAEHELGQDCPQYVKFRIGFYTDSEVTEGFGFDNVLIGEQPKNDIGVTSLVSVSSIPIGDHHPTIEITNFGFTDQTSFDLYYRIDQGEEIFVGSISGFVGGFYQHLEHVFSGSINFPSEGTYEVEFWTDLGAEERRENDTLKVTYTVQPTVVDFPYLKTFDTDTVDWASGGTLSSFQWGVPADSYINDTPPGTNRVWMTNLTGSHNEFEASYVESPYFNLNNLSHPYLRLDYKHNIHQTFGSGSADALAYIEFSSDGVNWQVLGTVNEGINWYNFLDNTQTGWNSQSDWKKGYFSLLNCVSMSNGILKFRVNFSSSGPLQVLDGFAFTNFQVLEAEPVADAGIIQVESPKVVAAGIDHFPTVQLANLGEGEITASATRIDYQIDGGAIKSAGLPADFILDFNDIDSSFTFLNPINIATPGIYELKIFIDQNSENQEVLSDTIVCDLKVMPFQTIAIGTSYKESFEADAADWCALGPNSSWEHGAPTGIAITEAADGTNAWVTNLTGAMNDGEQSVLYGPVFDLSSTTLPSISFDYFINTPFTTFFVENYPHVSYMEVSIDSGKTWSVLGTPDEDWYNLDGSNQQTPAGDFGWGGDTELLWQKMKYGLSSYAGQSWVQMRFVVLSTSSVGNNDGFGFDNIIVKEAEVNDVGATNMTSSLNVPEGDYEVNITIENFGLSTEPSFNVGFQVDGGTIVSELFNGGGDGLSVGATASFTFSNKALLSPGTHTLKVFTQLGTDTDAANDTFMVEVFAAPIISTFPYSQDFEGASHGWISGGTENSWIFGTPNDKEVFSGTADGSLNAWTTDTTGYNALEDSYVLSPFFNFNSVDSLYWQFDLAYYMEQDYDGVNLQYSLDTGQTWLVVDTTGNKSLGSSNWYNSSSVDGLNGNPGWSDQSDWDVSKVILPDTFNTHTGLVRFRVALGSDSGFQLEGAAFDNVKIAEIPDDDIGVVAILSDLFSNQGVDSFEVVIENFGFTDQTSLPVGYAIDGVPLGTDISFPTAPLSRAALDTFKFEVDLSGQTVGYHNLQIYTQLLGDQDFDNDTFMVSFLIQPLITTFPYVEGFESDGGFWVADKDGLFEVGEPNGDFINSAFEGDSAWVTLLDGEILSSNDSYVLSPELDFSGLTNPFIYFYYKAVQSSSLTQLEYSLDSGSTWTVVGDTASESNWYNVEDRGEAGWQSLNDWLRAFHPLTSLAGESSVRLRFLYNGAFDFNEGFAFDLVKVGDAGVPDVGVHTIDGLLDYPQNIPFTTQVGLTNYGASDVGVFDVKFEADGQSIIGTTLSGLTSSFNGVPYTDTLDLNVSLPNAGTFEYKVFTELAGDTDSDNDTLTGTINVIPTINTYPNTQSFEGTNGDWSVGGEEPSWQRGVPAGAVISSASDGSQAWMTNLDGSGGNESFEESYLISPYYDFSAIEFPVLYFDLFLHGGIADFGEGGFEFNDLLYMEYTTDFGQNWNMLGTLDDDWYNTPSNATESLNPENHALWADDESSAGWQKMRQDLSFLGGQSAVRFRFVYNHMMGGGYELGRVIEELDGEGFGFDQIEMINEDPRIVTNFNDSGAGSLRAAIEYSNQNPGYDSIMFEVSNDTILWTSPVFITDDSLVINMSGFNITVKVDDAFTGGTEVLTVAASYVELKDFALDVNLTDHGIQIQDGKSNVSLTRLVVANADVSGITCQGGSPSASEVLIEDCTVYNCGLIGIVACDQYTIINNAIGTDETGTVAIGGQDIGLYLFGDSSLVQGNVISGNDSLGVLVQGKHNELYSNAIGTDTSTLVDLGNGSIGLYVLGNYNKIGDADFNAGNVISGNDTSQIVVNGGMANFISGNYIGTNAPGDATVLMPGLEYGVELINGAALDTLDQNYIIGHPKGGVLIDGSSTVLNIAYKNTIFGSDDGFSGILIENGAQQGVLPPEITAADTASGFVYGNAAPNVRVQVYADSLGEGRLFLGDALAGATGRWELDASAIDVDVNTFQTLTALQDSAGNTSAFSDPFILFPTLVKHTGESGIGSLPYVLNYTNTHDGPDTVLFTPDLDGTVFTLSTSLPALVDDGTIIIADIDGDCKPDIELDGTNVGGVGLEVKNKNTIIYGMAITNYNTGILFDNSDSGLVLSSYIGLGLSGLEDKGNNNGIIVQSNSNFTVIGSDSVCWRNVISGNNGDGIQVSNSDSTLIMGNFIGLGVDGDTILPNLSDGIDVRDGSKVVFVGNTAGNTKSVISGNGLNAIRINNSETVFIMGNYLGTDSTGTLDKGNGANGIFLQNGAHFVGIGNGADDGRNIISGNSNNGVLIDGGTTASLVDSVALFGNFIGVDVTGATALPNSNMGVRVEEASEVSIGSEIEGDGNVISANGVDGVFIIENTDNILVKGNLIGTDSSGTLDLGNARNGVLFNSGSTNSIVGDGSEEGANVIAFNGEDGVTVIGSTTGPVLINQNSIFSNGQEGIHLNSGGNGGLVAPTILTILPDGTVYGSAEPSAYIQLYADSLNEGQQFLDATVTNSNGQWIIDASEFDIDPGLVNITATQTVTDSTSEFSTPFAIANIATTYTVITSADSVAGSLRAAIEYANSHSGADTINFLSSLNDSVIFLLDDLEPLNDLTGGTFINGDLDSDCNPDIMVDATSANYGFQVTSATNVIRGLSISNAILDGVLISGVNATNNLLVCNHIGTDLSGTVSTCGNKENGIHIQDGANGNIIGGINEGHNLISGNDENGILIEGAGSNNNIITNNYIGTDINGTNSLRNDFAGLRIIDQASHNVIGLVNGGRNIISGNSEYGISIEGASTDSNTVANNFIGTDVTSLNSVSNDNKGIRVIDGSSGNTIGGVGSGRNVISGNNGDGILLTGSGTSNNLIVSNYIGLDSTGLEANANTGTGIRITNGASQNFIGNGTDESRNVITGYDDGGITIKDATSINNVILGNYIGVDANCAAGLSNEGDGILLDIDVNNTSIGDGTQGGRNVIGASDNGIVVRGPNNTIFGNRIGADTLDGNAFGNSTHGIHLLANAQNDSIIGNIIANNDECGIRIAGETAFGNIHFNNALFDNVECGIAIIDTAQQEIRIPEINRVVPGGTVQGKASPNAFVHLYGGVDDFQGKYLVNTVTADASGNWELIVDYNVLPADLSMFLAVQDSNGNSSAYSNAIDFIDPLFVTNTDDNGIGSLRNALNSANPEDTIKFLLTDYPKTITLTSGALSLSSDDVVIDGPGADSLTISANGNSRVLVVSSASNTEIRGLTFADGFVVDGQGGGLLLTGGASILMEYCRVEDNAALNTELSGQGGGVFIDSESDLTARFCSFSGNHAFEGGAIYLEGLSIIESSTFNSNTTDNDGGAINNTNGTLSLLNTTISGNSANASGGGVYVSSGTASVISSTITQNTADFDGNGFGNGGGVAHIGSAASFTSYNTIYADNNDLSPNTDDQFVDLSGNFQSNGSIFVGVDFGSTIAQVGANNQIGTQTSPINPQLGELEDNGGFTLTHLPLPVSSVIDAGDTTGAPTFDQRGDEFPRIVGISIDIGAIEGIGGNTEVTSTHNLGSGSLWEAITIANLQEGLDTVTFNIDGTGPHTIVLDSVNLPIITDSLFINGYSQSGASEATVGSPAVLQIEIQGSSNIDDLLVVGANGVTISGLALNSTDSCAIFIDNAQGTVVEGNWIGLDANGNGMGSISSGSIGVCIAGASAQFNTIGGLSPSQRNIISGGWDDGVHLSDTASQNLIIGNYIGLSPSGLAELGNGSGVNITSLAVSNQIGGTGDSLNFISGNISVGVQVFGGVQNTIQGNVIGLRADNESTSNQTFRGIEFGAEATRQFVLDNVISNSQFAVFLNETTAGGDNTIEGNLIGTDTSGLLARPNIQGVVVTSNNSSITDNLIANSNFGVLISNTDVSGTEISGNDYVAMTLQSVTLTGTDVPLVNDVDDVDTAPANLGQNYPVICALDAGNDSVLIEGTLNSEGGTLYLIELLVSDSPTQGDGAMSLVDTIQVSIPIGSTTASFSHMLTGVDSSRYFVAAATNTTTNNSSELGVPATVVKAQFAETVLFGDSVFFDFTGFGHIDSWQWDFDGDGVDDFSSVTEQDPSFVYDTVGDHDVRLIVTPNTGCPDTLIQTITSTTPFLNELDSAALAAVYVFDSVGNGGNTDIPWNLAERTFTWDGVAIRAGWATGLDLSNYGMAHLLEDTLVNLSNRQLDSLNVSENKLDFADLDDLVAGYNGSILDYSPQGPLTEDRTFFTLVGQNFTIDEVPETLPSDAYQWLKSGVQLAGANERTFTISNTSSADTGVYVCEVTNDLVPDLTLLSGEITLALGRAMKQADSLALVSLYNAVGGDGGPLAGLWTGNAENWPGIVTEPDAQDSSRVVSIILNGLELDGEIPSEIFDLELITRIDLFNNNFSGTIPSNIGNATSLTYLDLDNNNLEGEIPVSIGNLVNLNTLWLARNRLTAMPPEIGNLTNLVNFFIQVNLLTAVPDEINNLSNLEVFNLSDNDIEAVPRVDGLTKLQDFRLRSNMISDFSSVNAWSASDLKTLDLSENELDTLPEINTTIFPSLQTLKVGLNRLDFADIGQLPFKVGEGFDVLYTPQKQQIPQIDTLVLQNGSITLTTSVELYPGASAASHDFQWFKDDLPISGATNETFVINNMSIADTGRYYCEIFSDSIPLLRVVGNTTKVELDCSVSTINVTISGASTTVFCESAPVNVLLGVDQDDVYSYRWFKNDVEELGSIGRFFAASELATYKVLVRDQDGCQAFSNELELTTLPLPEVAIELTDDVNLKATVTANETDGGIFQWYLNGLPLAGETDSFYRAREVGEYTVSYTNDNGCEGFASMAGVVTGLDDNEFSRSITIFPNPSAGTFNLQFGNVVKGELTINVFSASGVLVTQVVQDAQELIMMDLTESPSGIYFIEVIIDGKRAMKRFSKQ